MSRTAARISIGVEADLGMKNGGATVIPLAGAWMPGDPVGGPKIIDDRAFRETGTAD